MLQGCYVTEPWKTQQAWHQWPQSPAFALQLLSPLPLLRFHCCCWLSGLAADHTAAAKPEDAAVACCGLLRSLHLLLSLALQAPVEHGSDQLLLLYDQPCLLELQQGLLLMATDCAVAAQSAQHSATKHRGPESKPTCQLLCRRKCCTASLPLNNRKQPTNSTNKPPINLSWI
jgi:hypothetical protein